MNIKKNALILIIFIHLLGCSNEIDFPKIYRYERVEVNVKSSVVGLGNNEVSEISTGSQIFTDPSKLLNSFGAPGDIVSITLLSDTELKLTSGNEEEVRLTYESLESQILNSRFSAELKDNSILLNACMTITSPVGQSQNVIDGFCSHESFPAMQDLFIENNLSESDTLGFVQFNAIYIEE